MLVIENITYNFALSVKDFHFQLKTDSQIFWVL